nr:hypothetical protein [Nonomuraea aridisoli]
MISAKFTAVCQVPASTSRCAEQTSVRPSIVTSTSVPGSASAVRHNAAPDWEARRRFAACASVTSSDSPARARNRSSWYLKAVESPRGSIGFPPSGVSASLVNSSNSASLSGCRPPGRSGRRATTGPAAGSATASGRLSRPYARTRGPAVSKPVTSARGRYPLSTGGLGGVAEGGLGLRGVEVRRPGGVRAQVVEELLADQPPPVRGHRPGLGHRRDHRADPGGEPLTGRGHGFLAYLVTLSPVRHSHSP